VDDGEKCGGRAVAAEGAAAGDHLIQNHAERPQVRAAVKRFLLGLLGRHVGDRAGHAARLRIAGRADDARQAEIEDFGEARQG